MAYGVWRIAYGLWRMAYGESRALIASEASKHVRYRDSKYDIRHTKYAIRIAIRPYALGAYASVKNSSRVFWSDRNDPRTALVSVFEFCFSTPRIIMQR